MYAIAAIILLQSATIYVLARRLHAIDTDLATWDYFKRIARAQNRLGTLLMGSRGELELARKPDGTPITRAFVPSVVTAVGCGLAYVVVAAGLTLIYGG